MRTSTNVAPPLWRRTVPDEAAVDGLAARFAAAADPPLVLYLQGDLGAGKTTFARAYVHALGYRGYVKSPSYGLLETYATGGQNVLHLDLYRIEDPEELEFLALRDLFDEGTVMLIEWPERGEGHLPGPDLTLHFSEDDGDRFIECRAASARGLALARTISEGLR